MLISAIVITTKSGLGGYTMRYEYAQKPKRCPVCKGSRIAEILWGLPNETPKLKADVKAGRIVFGGCIVSDDDPVWKCVSCNAQFHRKHDDFMEYCVYTIRHSHDIKTAYNKGGKGKFTENRPWTTAEKIFMKAKKAGSIFPIVFGYAERIHKVKYWARVTDIKISIGKDGKKNTTYSFDRLSRIPDKRYIKDLVLKSTRKTISPGFIRPLAVCITPDYILQLSKAQAHWRY